jgi:hypothetical protein
MKITAGILLLAVGFLAPHAAQAQGTTYISNLNRPSTGSFAIGSDAWFAGQFHTGMNTSGYDLNSVRLQMNTPTGNPSGFSVSIYTESNVSPRPPEMFLGNLTGLDPSTAGVFTFATSGIKLSPSTDYYIVLRSATPAASGSYSVSLADASFPNNFDSSEGWIPGPYYLTSIDGSSWTSHRLVSRLQFAVQATAIPEPSAISLLLLGIGGLAYACRRSGKNVLVEGK